MRSSDLTGRLTTLQVWKRGDERAPHKPLLILYALGQLRRNSERLLAYEDIDRALGPLLRDFGPTRGSYHPEYPFWRLQHDGIWEVRTDHPLVDAASKRAPSRGALVDAKAAGGFMRDIYDALKADPTLISVAATAVLERYFPAEVHSAVRTATGLR